MTKDDLIGIHETVYTKQMFFNPQNAAVVCAKHNQDLFQGTLKSRKVSRGAGCYYCDGKDSLEQ